MRLAVLSGEGSIFLRQCPVDLFSFSWVLLENGVWGEPAGVLPHPCAIRPRMNGAPGTRRICLRIDNQGMTTSERWVKAIRQACAEPNPARSNQLITALHYSLSEALANALGQDAGPNFHTWAVWGSRKAGETIRQEDLDDAIRNATITAGIVGAVIGGATAAFLGPLVRISSKTRAATAGVGLGMVVGGWMGQQIAVWSRKQAAKLVLEGNRTVLQDIGEQSARFVQLLEEGATNRGREEFFAGLRNGPSKDHGQNRLATAFHFYLSAADSNDPRIKREAMIAGNCEIVYHEHIRLEPYIRGAMPWIIRRCATERMMTYEVGEHALRVGADIPGTHTFTAAKDWTKIEERMRYVFALFRELHDAPEVFSAP